MAATSCVNNRIPKSTITGMIEYKNRKTISNRALGVFAAALMGLLVSCVSIKTPKRSNLVALQAPMEVGKYPVSINRTIKGRSQKDTVIKTVVWYYFKNSERQDSLELAKATHIELKLPDEKHIVAILYSDGTALKTETIKGKLKNGYFRSKHDFSIKGVPPFYWSASSAKMQVGVGKEGQLYIDSADETNGSILIMVAGTPGFTRSLTVPVYEKQKKSVMH